MRNFAPMLTSYSMLHTHTDLLRMRSNVAISSEPWTSDYNALRDDSLSSLTRSMSGPLPYFERNQTGSQTGLAQIIADGRAAINLALMYFITQDTDYAIKSRDILDAWSSTLSSIGGTDRQLGASLPGINLVNAVCTSLELKPLAF